MSKKEIYKQDIGKIGDDGKLEGVEELLTKKIHVPKFVLEKQSNSQKYCANFILQIAVLLVLKGNKKIK